MEHVKLLADRIENYLEGLRESRGIAEKHAWFLRASLES